MKKAILFFVTILIAISANAQFASSGSQLSFGKASDTKRFVTYVKAGVSFNSITYNKSVLDILVLALDGGKNLSVGSNIGYHAVFGFQYSMIEDLGLYAGLEIGAGTRGAGITLSETYRYETYVDKIKLLTHSGKATPQIGYKLSLTDLIALDAHVGAVLSYDFAGKIHITELCDGEIEDSETIDLSDYDDYFNRFDVGIAPGITLWVGPVGIDFTYQRGFIGLSSLDLVKSTTKSHSQNFLLGLAFQF